MTEQARQERPERRRRDGSGLASGRRHDDAEAWHPDFRKHPLEWALRAVADVRPGESRTVLLLSLNVFLIFLAYYLVKVAREPLILTGGGAEVKSYAAAGQSMLLVFVASAYGWLAARYDRMKLVATVTLFFVANLVLFAIVGQTGASLGVPFYLWVGVFSVTVISQFWGFAADVYTEEQGKRLFPVVGIGSSVGAASGATVAKLLVRHGFGPFALMYTCSAILVVCLGITWLVNRSESRKVRRQTDEREPEPLSKESGFVLLMRDRYLLLLGALALILNWVNTIGEYVLDRTLLAVANSGAAGQGITPTQFIGHFKADYFGWVNIVGVVLQLFVVSRVMKYIGIRKALFVLPVIALVDSSILAVMPILSFIFVAKIAENSVDYSLSNTVRHALWLNTSRDAKYKAKQVVDSFLMRAGDVLAAAVVWLGTRLAFGTKSFILCNIALAILWLLLVTLLAREHKKRELAVPVAVVAALVAFFAFSGEARAETPKRPTPNYDGRAPEPTTAGDVALWVPRVVFFPPYLVSEYVVRRPMGALLTAAERGNWPSVIVDFLTFDKEKKVGIVPTALVDFGFRLSVGLYFFWDDFLAKGNDLRVGGSFGGTDFLAASVVDRVKLSKDSSIELGVRWLRRPDNVFHGEGARSLESERSRYGATTFNVAPAYDLAIGPHVRYRARAGLRYKSFREGAFDEDPSLLQQVNRGVFAVPPGFPEGYTEGYGAMGLILDSRAERPAPQSGVRLRVEGEHGTDVAHSPGRSWVKYGASVGGFWDLSDQQRVLSLTFATEFADPVHGGPIPFTEQVVWGGTGALRGFRPGRLVGRSAAAATLQYEWPIWVWLDGVMHVAVGNVFDAGLEDFAPKLLRVSSGIGFRTTSSPDRQFEVLAGVGSETFDQGAEISSFRLAIGTTGGF
jgi:AAA family ATP:ADP antiporter